MSCGECFTNWDRILTELNEKTKGEVDQAQELKATGVTGSYYKTYFDSMESMLSEVRSILEGGSISNEELEEVQEKINEINEVLSGKAFENSYLVRRLYRILFYKGHNITGSPYGNSLQYFLWMMNLCLFVKRFSVLVAG